MHPIRLLTGPSTISLLKHILSDCPNLQALHPNTPHVTGCVHTLQPARESRIPRSFAENCSLVASKTEGIITRPAQIPMDIILVSGSRTYMTRAHAGTWCHSNDKAVRRYERVTKVSCISVIRDNGRLLGPV